MAASMPPSFTVVSYMSQELMQNNAPPAPLQLSAAKLGYDLRLVGTNLPWKGLYDRNVQLRQFFLQQDLDAWFLIADGNDVVLLSPPDELAYQMHKAAQGKRLMFGTEVFFCSSPP